MSEKAFERRTKGDKPVLAICYDFDKTLSPDDMQAQGYIQSVNCDVKKFWEESNKRAEDNEMDTNLSYMYQMIEYSEGRHIFNKEMLMAYGAKVKLFPGVEEWFQRIKAYGKDYGVVVEHYVISSGLKEMIKGTKVADEFERIYASSFYYNDKGVAKWPAQVVNFTNKTQFLFRIEKGVLDINDDKVNEFFAPDQLRIPFRNIVYIGDSDTDIPCMKLVNTNGGYSIGVYDPKTKEKSKVYKMLNDNRIQYYAPADYTAGSELDKLLLSIIQNTATNERLKTYHFGCAKEATQYAETQTKEEQRKRALIYKLLDSGSFATTHSIIKELSVFDSYTDKQAEFLAEIAIENDQVYLILDDKDIHDFFSKLIGKTLKDTGYIKRLAKALQ